MSIPFLPPSLAYSNGQNNRSSDYTYALKQCKAINTPYVAIFEDDVILADGWMTKTLKAIADINKRQQAQFGAPYKSRPWLYLRLFFTETSMWWDDSDFAYRNMPLIFIIAMFSTFATLQIVANRRLAGRYSSYLDISITSVISFVAVPGFIGLAYMTGKYSLLVPNGVVEMNERGCCTQGLVFPGNQIDGLVYYLTEKKAYQVDSAIEEYATRDGLNRYAVMPQQLQHVGLKSSRKNLESFTKSTWAFWFEENDPGRLRMEHDRLLGDPSVKELLG